uniref:Protein FAR1-RELATED SEQUENCE n=1 Tax=Setaria italica TaxID=4555 RepID=K3XQ57_SETIT
MPFAPFARIRGHGLTCIFGCALLFDETTETFKWLFSTFLHSMGEKEPQSIMADQDNAMKSANAQISHMQIIEFQTINKHEIQRIKYFQDIYDSRERWAPVWFKQDFYPFVSTTTRSEGINERYKRIVGPQYSITSFLKDMEAYNLKIFHKFQWQLRHATKLQADEIEKNRMYEVYTCEDQLVQECRRRRYIVIIDLQNEDLSCICAKFQKDGMLCCHILKVMMKNDISKIPENYIIDRWRKKETMIQRTNECLPVEATTLRFNNLSLMAAEMNSKGAKSDDKYNYLSKEIERPTKSLKRCTQMMSGASNRNITGASIHLIDPDVAATKGKPTKLKSNKRMVPKAEEMRKKKEQKYNCQKCKSSCHNIATCPLDLTIGGLPTRIADHNLYKNLCKPY